MALHEVTWRMVVWCTQNLHRDGCSFMWHQPCQSCELSTPLRLIFKKQTNKNTRYKASHSCRTTCERNESAQESGELRCISDHQSKSVIVLFMSFSCFICPLQKDEGSLNRFCECMWLIFFVLSRCSQLAARITNLIQSHSASNQE